MNGAVFQTSATMTANLAAQGSVVQAMSSPVTELMMPSGAKMNCHSFAVTAVGIAHGISTAARSRPRPRKLRFITVAIHSPSSVSRKTVTTTKNRVIFSAGQKSTARLPGAQVETVPLGDMQRCVSQ